MKNQNCSKITCRTFFHTKKLTALVIIFTILMGLSFVKAQDSIMVKAPKLQPFRIGVKIGFPNAIGGHIEYVTPLLKKRLAPSIEYTSLKLDSFLDPDKGNVKYFEFGLNYYFGKRPGRGPYVHLGYGSFNGDYETEFSDGRTEKYEIDNGSMNIRVGAKAGGLFYFRPEIGYMFSPFPKTIDVIVSHSDGSNEVQTEETGILSSGLMFNFGIGFAF